MSAWGMAGVYHCKSFDPYLAQNFGMIIHGKAWLSLLPTALLSPFVSLCGLHRAPWGSFAANPGSPRGLSGVFSLKHGSADVGKVDTGRRSRRCCHAGGCIPGWSCPLLFVELYPAQAPRSQAFHCRACRARQSAQRLRNTKAKSVDCVCRVDHHVNGLEALHSRSPLVAAPTRCCGGAGNAASAPAAVVATGQQQGRKQGKNQEQTGEGGHVYDSL